MNWIILIIAGLFEVGFTSCLGKAKESVGNEMFAWYAGFLVCLVVSMVLLMKATQSLPLGTAYTIWTGIGAIGSFLVGIFILGEPATAMRMLAAILIVSGLVLMKLSSS